MSLFTAASVGELYRLCEAPIIERRLVVSDPLKGLSEALRALERTLGDSAADIYWRKLRRTLRSYLYLCTGAPLAFDDPSLLRPDRLEELRTSLGHCDFLYPQAAPYARQALEQLESVSRLSSNPLLGKCEEVATQCESGRGGLLLRHASLIHAVEDLVEHSDNLQGFHVLSQAQLRGDAVYEQLIVVGPPYWYPDYILTAPRASRIAVVQYAWLGGSIKAHRLFERQGSPRPVPVSGPSGASTEIGILSAVSTEDWDEIYESSSRSVQGESPTDAIRALPFALEGGWAVWLDAEEGGSAIVLDLDVGNQPTVHRTPVPELREGMFLLLRTSGGGDYVVAVADRLMGREAAGRRAAQAEWKKLLRDLIQQSGVATVCDWLARAGARHATEWNVRRWIWLRSIKPKDRADFDAIVHVTGLNQNPADLWRVMVRIDRAHRRAGQAIRKELLRQARHADLTELERLGRMSFELPDVIAGSLEAFRIIGIGSTPAMVPAHQVGHPFTAASVTS